VNLIIDIGNSYTKAAVFDNEAIITQNLYKNFGKDELSAFFNNYQITKAIISSVSHDTRKIFDYLTEEQHCNTLVLNSSTPIPLNIRYSTPKTLGSDRLAAATGGKHLFPENHVLVIDAGTCITYDLVTAEHNYLGGAISPGINMRYKAMNQFTQNLPLLKSAEDTKLTGDSTTNSIHSGVLNGAISEMDGMINQFREEYPNLITIITGGDINYFDKKLKNNIFARPNIVVTGLNQILRHNFEN